MTEEVLESQYNQMKAFLMRADADGNSVYDHLHSVMLDMLENNSLDAAHKPDRFSELSSLLTQQQFAYGNKSLPSGAKPSIDVTVTARSKENLSLFQKTKPSVTTTVEQPTPFTTVTTTTVTPPVAPSFNSLVNDSKLWRYCGVGLPEHECFLLDQSITKLALEKKLQDVRFVGKIFGTEGNYIIISSKRFVAENEVVLEEVNTMPKPPRKKVEVDIQAEPAYKGCNRLSYWVASHAAGEFTLLPDTTPQQINATRKFRKLFTGNLDTSVVAYPHFAGNEAQYLRAQLSRIVAATVIAPTGALENVTPEEEEAEEEEEGPPKPKVAKYWPLTQPNKEYAIEDEAGVASLLDTEQWVHSEAYIYETGRQTKVPEKPAVEEGENEEEDPEEEEGEEEKKEEEEKELFQPLKRDSLYAVIHIPKEPNPEEDEEEEPAPEEGEGEGEEKEEEEKAEEDDEIPDDDPLRKKLYPWVTRTTNMLYKKHGICIAKSLRWPGAVAYVGQSGRAWGCVYFGNGMKKTDAAFTPVPAPQIQKEAPDMVEVMDATAGNEKLVLRGEEPKEADSEDEKEDEEENEEADE